MLEKPSWLGRILCGVRRTFTASFSSWESRFPTAPSLAFCGLSNGPRHRTGRPFYRTTWGRSSRLTSSPYPVLRGLERDGALRSRRKTVNGRSRVYYSVTSSGSRRFADLSNTWVNLADAIQKMLIGGYYDEEGIR